METVKVSGFMENLAIRSTQNTDTGDTCYANSENKVLVQQGQFM